MTFKLVASYDTQDSDGVETAVEHAITSTGAVLKQLDSFDISPKRNSTFQNMRQQQQQQRIESLAVELVDALLEGRDDVTKLGLPKGAVAYARRTSKSMGRQPQEWANVQMSILNRGTPRAGFTCMDAGQTASGGRLKGSGTKFPKS